MANKMATMQGCCCEGCRARFSVTAHACGLTRVFTDESTSSGTITDWEYDFGDGETSTEQNPTHTFATTGTYTVTLTITDDLDCESTYSVSISVTVGTTSANEDCDCIEALAPVVSVVVTSDDIVTPGTNPCADCSPIVGTYILPFAFRAPVVGGCSLAWNDRFSITICGVTRDVDVELGLTLTALGGGRQAFWAVAIRSFPNAALIRHFYTYTSLYTSFADLINTPMFLPDDAGGASGNGTICASNGASGSIEVLLDVP